MRVVLFRFFSSEPSPGMDLLQELLTQFASGEYVVPMMVGAALGGGYVLGIARNSLSKVIVGGLGGVSVVAFFWIVANLLIYLADTLPPLV